MTFLIINPNTTEAITERLKIAAQAALPGRELRFSTGRFGGRYIASRATFAIASHAALDCFARDGRGAKAVLLACFGDPGLDALREMASMPVIGLIEASSNEAVAGGRRFGVVTGGERWRPMLTEAINLRGFGPKLVDIETVAPTGGEIANNPDAALAMLIRSCNSLKEKGAESVVLGGAGLVGLAPKISPQVGIPVICSVQAGLEALRATLHTHQNDLKQPIMPDPMPSVGLSPELAKLLEATSSKGSA